MTYDINMNTYDLIVHGAPELPFQSDKCPDASVDPWIHGCAGGTAGQPEKAAHRPWFRPTAQQLDWKICSLNEYKIYDIYNLL